MFSSLLVLALLPASPGASADLSEIAASVLTSSWESSGSVCLLQREQGQLRRSAELAEDRAAATAPKASPAAAHRGDASPLQGGGRNATAAQAQPPRKELTLSEVISGSSGQSGSITAAASSAWYALPITAGVTDGMGIDYSAQALSQVSIRRSPRGRNASALTDAEPKEHPEKNKVVLMVIEMFPLCWLFAIDRFYLGNIQLGVAKLLVSLGTCFVGGFAWGVVDFVIIMNNALRGRAVLDTAGLSAQFPERQLHMAMVLAIVDILMVPLMIGLARFVWWWRKQQRMERLKEAAMRSPHQSVEAHQVKGG